MRVKGEKEILRNDYSFEVWNIFKGNRLIFETNKSEMCHVQICIGTSFS